MVGGFGTRREAEAALAEALTKVGRGEVLATAMGLGAYLDQWLAGMRAQLAVTAWSNYAKLLHLYVPDTLRCRPLGKLTGPMLTTHYGELVDRGGQGGRPLSPTTVRLVHRILHKALADAVDAGLLAVNPVGRAKPPKRVPPQTSVWSGAQAAAFLRAQADSPLSAAWLLALGCGLRRGEIAGLRWGDVDLEQATLTVARQRTTDTGSKVIEKEPKGTSRRTLDLGTETVQSLRRHQARQSRELFSLGSPLPDRDRWVFTRPDGQPLHPQRLTDLFQAAAGEAGLPVIRLHDARHSCATLALTAGLHPKVVQHMLGHSSWSVTMDLYSHRVDRLQREASQRIEDLLIAD